MPSGRWTWVVPPRTENIAIALRVPAHATLMRFPGEVPERLNGRDWKSRNGG